MILSVQYTGSKAIPPGAKWIILNTYAGGYFRVKYDEWNFKKICQQLQSNHRVIWKILK